MKRVATIVLVLVLAVAMSTVAACGSSSSGTDGTDAEASASTSPGASTGDQNLTYTADMYAQISLDMTMDEADAIMGGGGATEKSKSGGETTVTVTYMNDDGSNITLMFVDGDMKSVSKSGL